MKEVLLKPTAEDIREAARQFDFDPENEAIEEALRDLFGQYPDNT